MYTPSVGGSLPRLVPLLLLLLACDDQSGKPPRGGDSSDTSGETGDTSHTGTWFDADGDGYVTEHDCDDTDPEVHPGAVEVCNEVDDDCDGSIDVDAWDAQRWFPDLDGDGWGDVFGGKLACACPPLYLDDYGDCDDSDPAIHPGVDELCNNTDDDCDGRIDDDPVDGTHYYHDRDGDGYGSGDGSEFCSRPPEASDLNTDCDDADDRVHPDQGDRCDDIDNDCDGALDEDPSGARYTWYQDADGDGFGDPAVTTISCTRPRAFVGDATDCDDTDRTRHPGGTEVCDDGVDQDCTDVDLTCFACPDGCVLSAADASWTGSSGQCAVAAVDGLTRGGGSDIVMGDTEVNRGMGGAYIWTGTPRETSVEGAGAASIGVSTGGAGGSAVDGAGDFDGDGNVDLLVGEAREASNGTEAGAAFIVLGPLSGPNAIDRDLTMLGENAYDAVGVAAVGAGDVNGDGLADVLLGAAGNDDAGRGSGAAYLVFGGGASGVFDLTGADARLQGEADNDAAGSAVSGVGDLNGDGLADLLIGADAADGAGVIYVVYAPVSGTVGLSVADARWVGEASGDEAGYALALAGDVDGDGTADLLIGAPRHDGGGRDAGAVYLVNGGLSGSLSLASPTARLVGGAPDDQAGFSVAGPGDIDGDGVPDVFIGVPGRDDGGADAGAAYLLHGPLSGTVAIVDTGVGYIGDSRAAGSCVAGAGDLDGNGTPDLLIGAPQSNPGIFLVYTP